MAVRLSKFQHGDSDFPLSYLVNAGVITLRRIGRWPFRRYGLQINDPTTFAGATIDADNKGVRLTCERGD